MRNYLIGDVTEIVSGYAFKSKKFNTDGIGMPVIRIRDVGKENSETFTEEDYPNHVLINKGDFLVGMDGEFRLAEWKGHPSLLNQRVCKVIPNTRLVNPRFLFFFLPKELKKIEEKTSYATVKHLSVKKIQKIKIPLPPLEIQKKIAEVLDKADAIRQRNRLILQKYDQLAQSVFLDMFGDFIEKQKKCKSNPLLSDISEVVSGVTKNSRLKSEDIVTLPYMRVANVQDGYIDLSEIKDITVKVSDAEKYQLQKGDILLTEGGDPDKLGRGAVWYNQIENCIHQNHIFRVRPNVNIVHPEYLSSLIGSKYGKVYFLRAAKQTTGIATINSTQLRKFPVLIPEMKLQLKYAETLMGIDKQKISQQIEIGKSEELFQSLLQRAFKGELFTQQQEEMKV